MDWYQVQVDYSGALAMGADSNANPNLPAENALCGAIAGDDNDGFNGYEASERARLRLGLELENSQRYTNGYEIGNERL